MVKTAHVGISRISELHITPLPMERRYDSTGDLSVHPEVAARYIAAGYNQAPKSKEERNARGLTGGWNGMNTSLVNIRQYATNDGSLFVSADIAPARYLLGKAAEDVVDVGKFRQDDHGADTIPFKRSEIAARSPDMANVSLVVPVEYGGDFYLLAQIKGDAKGSGEIHTGLAAGGVKPVHLQVDDPLIEALSGYTSKELGIDLSSLNPSSAAFMVDERFQGMVNFAYIANRVSVEEVLDSYASETNGKDKTQIAGLALVPLQGAVLHEVPDTTKGVRHRLDDLLCFIPGEDGLEEHRLDKIVRPYTVATTRFTSASEDNIRFFLEKAGF